MRNKGWSLLFGGVMLAATISVVISPLVGWGLPKNVSSYGPDVDLLFHVILFVTGFFFILTETLLVYFMYAFAGRTVPPTHPAPSPRPWAYCFTALYLAPALRAGSHLEALQGCVG